MKILCDHQTGYLPWLGLFHRISLCDIYVSLDTVKYTRSSWDDRNKIITPSGTMWLKVPTIKGKSKILKDIKIDNSTSWKDKHIKSIKHSYGKTEYFKEYFPLLKDIYNINWEYLIDLNEELLKFFLKELNIKVKFYKASDFDIPGVKNDYLVNICKNFKADFYVFGQMGKEYADENLFKENNINLYFHTYKHPIYPQRRNINLDFIPYLSIIDLLFNVGSQKALEYINKVNISKSEMICKNITIKKVTEDDCRAIFDLVNEKDARSNTFSPQPITYENHVNWFSNALKNKNMYLYIIKIGKEIVGHIKFTNKRNDSIYVGIVLEGSFRNKGLGTKILKYVTDDFIFKNKGINLLAEIKPENIYSILTFQNAGFNKIFENNDKLIFIKN